MNAPNPATLFMLEEGEAAIEIIEDTKIPNAATFKIVKQDHTLGNMLRAQLLSMPQALFAGYKVPHPLQPYFLIKLQTDGTISPQDLMERATKELVSMIASVEQKFKKEFQFKEADASGMRAPAAENPYGSEWATTGTQDYLDL